jgi:hypothetical protein
MPYVMMMTSMLPLMKESSCLILDVIPGMLFR